MPRARVASSLTFPPVGPIQIVGSFVRLMLVPFRPVGWEGTPMMTIHLNAAESRRREDTFHTTQNRRLRDRCQAILMAARGRRHRQIAEDLGLSVPTRHRWLNAYHAEGLDGPAIQWASGRAPHSPEALASEMLAWVTPGPAGCGLDRANWTYAALTAHLDRLKGIAVSASTMRACGTKHGVRPDRPPDLYLKANLARQSAAQQDLQALKKR
jgi:transposase